MNKHGKISVSEKAIFSNHLPKKRLVTMKTTIPGIGAWKLSSLCGGEVLSGRCLQV